MRCKAGSVPGTLWRPMSAFGVRGCLPSFRLLQRDGEWRKSGTESGRERGSESGVPPNQCHSSPPTTPAPPPPTTATPTHLQRPPGPSNQDGGGGHGQGPGLSSPSTSTHKPQPNDAPRHTSHGQRDGKQSEIGRWKSPTGQKGEGREAEKELKRQLWLCGEQGTKTHERLPPLCKGQEARVDSNVSREG